jgi:hypothetical protein
MPKYDLSKKEIDAMTKNLLHFSQKHAIMVSAENIL